MFKDKAARPFSLSTEIVGMFTLLGLLPLFLIGWQYYNGAKEQLLDEISRSLSALADNKVERVEAFARNALKDVQVLANSSLVTRAMVQLSLSGTKDIAETGRELRQYSDDIQASDLFLISASGEILFAAHREKMIGIDLHKSQKDFHLLASAFDRARTLLEPHNSDFAKDVSSVEPSGFVAAPILRSGHVLGVVALRMNKENLFRIVSDYSGLGRTGETMVAVKDRNYPEIYGSFRFPISFDRDVRKSFDEALMLALSGQRNVGLINDYRGKEVIAAWRYVPSFRWALLVKVDVEERLEPITRLRNMGFLFLTVMALLVILVSVLMARAITTPIRQLEIATRNLSETGSTDMVSERGAWEITSLAKGFNAMSQRIQSYQTGLRKMVDERTAELKNAKDEAEKATRAKTDFLAMMSHEIRTPLNGLLGMAELLKTQEMGPLARDYVYTLHQSGAALSDLLNDLLDISRIEAGKLDLENKPFSPQALLESLNSLMKRSAEIKGLAYESTVAQAVPENLLGDPARLRQILLNLTGNAIKFTAQGKITIQLDVFEQDTEKVVLRFLVQDSGIGMKTEELSKLFLPFSQLSEGRSRKYGGAGLGLAISQRLAERMGGKITVESQPGKGSLFCVTLPFNITDKTDVVSEDIHLIPPQQIMIVEDEPINRRVLTGLLRRDGHRVLSCSSGEEALETLVHEPVNLVLSDLRLPGISGLEVIKKVTEELNLPVIAVTANLMPEDVQNCIDAGALDVIPKPIFPDTLRRTLYRAIADKKRMPDTFAQPIETEFFSPDYLNELMDVLPHEDIKGLINKAEQSVSVHLENLRKAYENNSPEEIADHAHKIAGVSGTYGMVELRKIAKQIEKDKEAHPFAKLHEVSKRSVEKMNLWAKKNLS